MRRLLTVSALIGAMACVCVVAATPDSATSQTLVVHEWGTFTSFQDAQGATIGGINVDDEPVPAFVHRLRDLPIFTAGTRPANWSQGAPGCHAGVTLRLETPVVYFYPPAGFRPDQRIDVQADFVGGWLTEFYPHATVDVPGFPETLTASTRGSLIWSGLRLAGQASLNLPQTDAPVWLAPRKVSSSVVTAPIEEEEKYLFYRGVGHLDAPLVVTQQGEQVMVSLRAGESQLKQLPPSWLVRVLPDGKVWYRALRTDDADSGKTTLTLPRDDVASAGNSDLDSLRRELASALASAGLFRVEASAMLETWKLSYFESEGVRLFFLLPQAWTDAQLPLSISVPSRITRVMMGRIELISEHQHAVLRQLYDLPAEALQVPALYLGLANNRDGLSDREWRARWRKTTQLLRDRTTSHAAFYKAVGREVPEALRLYDSLGRFRDALLVHELASAGDEATRQRVRQIISTFSACLPSGLRE